MNQLMMVFNISIFGAISGAQFFGCKDYKGVRNTFRFKIYACLALIVLDYLFLALEEKNSLYYISLETSRGQLLGTGELEEAKEADTKMIVLTVMSCLVMGSLLALFAPLFPKIYNTTDTVKALATSFMRASAVCMPLHGFMHLSVGRYSKVCCWLHIGEEGDLPE